jgi:hypothetical protein
MTQIRIHHYNHIGRGDIRASDDGASQPALASFASQQTHPMRFAQSANFLPRPISRSIIDENDFAESQAGLLNLRDQGSNILNYGTEETRGFVIVPAADYELEPDCATS